MSSSKPAYVPEFQGVLEGWTVNHIKKNMWRVRATQEFEDVMQEAHCVFLKLKLYYADTVTEPQHFTALYKTSWQRKFIDLANADTAQRAETHWDETENRDGHAMHEPIGELNNDGELATMLRQAPNEVLQVLNLFLNCPQEILDLALTSWDRRFSGGGSKKICQLLGISPQRDVMGATIDYLEGR